MKKVLFTLFMLSFSNYASESIGFYSDGKIKDSYHIHVDHNYVKLFKTRGQNFTSDTMAQTLKTLANYINENFTDAEKMEVGDLSALNGGKINRHLSHQNGLDADIVYLRTNRTPSNANNPEWDEYFVTSKGLSKNFDTQRNWQVFRYLVQNFDVGRIFVDAAIKRYYCKNLELNEHNIRVLRRLRPAKYHKTHLHLRLKCPKGQRSCKEQVEPPAGHGCRSVAINDLSV